MNGPTNDKRVTVWSAARRALVAVIAAAAVSTGCSYAFLNPGARALPEAWKRVAVPAFDNRSAELSLGPRCARGLHDRLAVGRREVVTDPNGAGLVVRGVITDVRERPVAYEDLGARGRSVELELIVSLDLVASAGPQEVWRVEGATGARLMSATGTPADIDAERRAAVIEACAEAASLAIDGLVDHLLAHPELEAWSDTPPRTLTDDASQAPQEEPAPLGSPPGEPDRISEPRR